MQIRIMTIEDYEEVYNLWINCPGMGLNDVDDTKEGIAQYLKRNPDTCFVAIEDDHIVGSILCGNDGRRGYISHTAVLPSYQRKGIGTKLVQSVLDALKKNNIKKVNLVVFSRNQEGNAFWQKLGFEKRNDLTYRDYALTKITRFDT